MDEHTIAQLVADIEAAFPGDVQAQRSAWEFIESVTSSWLDDANDRASVPAQVDPILSNANGLLHAAGGQLLGVIHTFLAPTPAFGTLGHSEANDVLILPGAVSTGVSAPIVLEFGEDFVTLLASLNEGASPAGLGAILLLPDGTVRLERFAEIDSGIAAAHFDETGNTGTIGVGLVSLPDPDEPDTPL